MTLRNLTFSSYTYLSKFCVNTFTSGGSTEICGWKWKDILMKVCAKAPHFAIFSFNPYNKKQ
jgi:hypothetical protein